MKIAFLEDNREFASVVVAHLQISGHEVDHFMTGRECLKALHVEQYDVVLLDWEVPDMSGLEVLQSLKLRGNYPPVVFLTGRDAEEDVISVIESGADDYIVKPPNHKLLLSRINALYRRVNPSSPELTQLTFGSLSIDIAKRTFEIDGQLVKLTEKEIDLALFFFKQVGVLLPRPHIMKVVWGTSPDIDTRTLDVHVSHLRNKLNLLPQEGWRLISVYQQGYRLERIELE
jgi:two-component system response regulator RegX3